MKGQAREASRNKVSAHGPKSPGKQRECLWLSKHLHSKGHDNIFEKIKVGRLGRAKSFSTFRFGTSSLWACVLNEFAPRLAQVRSDHVRTKAVHRRNEALDVNCCTSAKLLPNVELIYGPLQSTLCICVCIYTFYIYDPFLLCQSFCRILFSCKAAR